MLASVKKRETEQPKTEKHVCQHPVSAGGPEPRFQRFPQRSFAAPAKRAAWPDQSNQDGKVAPVYQCVSFYSANRILDESRSAVIAAWSVVADAYYHYDMQGDDLGYPGAFCLIRTIEGRGRLQTRSGEILLSENEYILLKRGEIRYYSAADKLWAYYWVDFLWAEAAPVQAGRKLFAQFEENEKRLFEELLQAGLRHPEELCYINGIFTHYFYGLCLKDGPAEEKARRPILAEEICSYMEQKLYSKLTVQDVADFFQISARRLHQIFQPYFHMSPKQYINNMKVEKAKQILSATSTPVTDIAALLGFDNAYHFSSVFKKTAGCSPSAYRAEHGAGA